MIQWRRSALPSVGQHVRSTTRTANARPPRFRPRTKLRCRPATFSPIAVTALALGLLTPLAAGNDVVDPFDVIAAVDRTNQLELWPGFDVTAYPVAIFDGNRTLLLRHPSPPEGFEHLEGHDGVWVYPGKHPAMRWNSNADIGGVRTATLLLTIEPGRPVEYEAHILYHEIFHLFSKPLHPTWKPNEMWRFSYPMGDLENYRQLLLEEEALARAVESSSDEEAASWAVAALEIRTDRQERLRQEHLTFETLLELQEGTAVYMGRSTIGIATETERLREDRGPDGIRWRCYETGAAVAVILDRLLPGWKVELDAKPETTLTGLLKKAVKAADVQAASFSDDELARTSARAEGAVAELTAKRAQLYQVFDERGKKVIVRLSSDGERFAFGRFDPMAVEVLEHGEALHANLLTSTHPRGEFRLTNPHFARRSLDGVIAFTSPAGEHPFLQGYQKIAVSGFQGEPAVERTGSVVSVEAEGLSISFDGAEVESTDEALIITVLPVDTSGVPPVK